jgi:hypothetical protein
MLPTKFRFILPHGFRGEDFLKTVNQKQELAVAPSFVNCKKGCTRLTATSDKVYQLLAHGRWFSPGTPASSTTKTARHDIAEVIQLPNSLSHLGPRRKFSINQPIRNKNCLWLPCLSADLDEMSNL